MPSFTRATKAKARLRMALIGPAGSGKTYSALAIASGIGERTAVIDTEHGSAAKFANLFTFDSLELDTYHPQKYIEAIKAAGAEAYDVLIIDSLSHAWSGTGGVLEMVDRARGNNPKEGFSAWKNITPIQNQLIETILSSPCHVIATIRSKMGYEQVPDGNGRTKITKVGLQPVQRDGIEYEFDIVGDLTDGTLNVTKSRWEAIAGASFQHPGAPLGNDLRAWCNEGIDAPPRPQPKVETPTEPEQRHETPPEPSGDSEVLALAEDEGIDFFALARYINKPMSMATADRVVADFAAAKHISVLQVVKNAALAAQTTPGGK